MTDSVKPHNHLGNCWEDSRSCLECGCENLCDTCHEHDQPRGECVECQPCDACDLERLNARAFSLQPYDDGGTAQ